MGRARMTGGVRSQGKLKEGVGMQIKIYKYKYKSNVLIELCRDELVRYFLLS